MRLSTASLILAYIAALAVQAAPVEEFSFSTDLQKRNTRVDALAARGIDTESVVEARELKKDKRKKKKTGEKVVAREPVHKKKSKKTGRRVTARNDNGRDDNEGDNEVDQLEEFLELEDSDNNDHDFDDSNEEVEVVEEEEEVVGDK